MCHLCIFWEKNPRFILIFSRLCFCLITGHLFYKFGITESDWYRIKQSIDSKCRTAWRRKQRGQSLAVKSFSRRTPSSSSYSGSGKKNRQPSPQPTVTKPTPTGTETYGSNAICFSIYLKITLILIVFTTGVCSTYKCGYFCITKVNRETHVSHEVLELMLYSYIFCFGSTIYHW